MSHILPKLPYNDNALEPYISRKTIEFHYGKHHQAYVSNLNNLIAGTKFENTDLETIIKTADGGIFNNGAQIWNHTFYFFGLSPKPVKEPGGQLAIEINNEFGSLQGLIDKFSQTANSLFGSGWVWLVKKHNGGLGIISESNAGNPIIINLKPIAVIDVWEHAYYLDYQNRRAEYIKNFWNIFDWKIVTQRYNEI
ncbi:MAG: superoxide dismutase [Bacteroidales bacterium]|nr:superoxide dismutase [Bacteroidales bacterium]